jgi:hypothetical protein
VTGLLERGNLFLAVGTGGRPTRLSWFNGEYFDLVDSWRTPGIQEIAEQVADYASRWPSQPRVLVVRSSGIGVGILDILQKSPIIHEGTGATVQVVSDRISARQASHPLDGFHKLREACGVTRADLVKHGVKVDANGNIQSGLPVRTHEDD